MEYRPEGVVIVVGNYGSGKTEVSINLAVNQRKHGRRVRIADLDLVNPYFRTREARSTLRRLGIEIILPPESLLHADLPILDPAIAGILHNPDRLTLLDVGGNDAGATVLGALADHLADIPLEVLQVVNPFRPYTDTIDGCLKIRDEIQAAARISITGWVGNANLMDETDMSHIYQGYGFLKALSEKSGAPLHFITVMDDLEPRLDRTRIDCPVLKISRQLVPPWKKAGTFQ